MVPHLGKTLEVEDSPGMVCKYIGTLDYNVNENRRIRLQQSITNVPEHPRQSCYNCSLILAHCWDQRGSCCHMRVSTSKKDNSALESKLKNIDEK